MTPASATDAATQQADRPVAREVPLPAALLSPPPPKPSPESLAEQGLSGLLMAVPPLRWRSSVEVERAWRSCKSAPSLSGQLAEIRRQKLPTTGCSGLVDFRRLGVEAPFRYRDDVRGRSWATPTLARIIVGAYTKLREEFPEVTLTLGDIAQPGCGQLEHGTLVRYVTDAPDDDAATHLMNQARYVGGFPTVRSIHRAFHFHGEHGRFETQDEPVLVETRVLAHEWVAAEPGSADDVGERLRLKTETRRYHAMELPDARRVDRMIDVVEALQRRGEEVRSRRVADWDSERGDERLWEQHWIAPDRKRQVITWSKRKLRRGRAVRERDLIQVRLARWQPRKPGSLPHEIRWLRSADPLTGERLWQRWLMLYEAGHQTHLAGRDADISYVTRDNTSHFAKGIQAIDVPKTLRWFALLDEAALDAGVEIDRILIDPRVKRYMRRKLSKKQQRSRVFRKLIRLAGGHDAHHHIRISTPSPQIEQASLNVLMPSGVAAQ